MDISLQSWECINRGECIDKDLIPDNDRIVSDFGFPVGHSKPLRDVAQNKRVVVETTETLEEELPKSVINIQNEVRGLKIPEQVSEHKFSGAFPLEHSAKNEVTNLPRPKNLAIRVLKTPFNKSDAVLLNISSLVDPTAKVRHAFKDVYTLFESMAPSLTVQMNKKYFRCRGYYTRDFETCIFDAQIWRLHRSVAVLNQPDKKYIFELLRTSHDGREPFDALLRAVAGVLQLKGHADQYANGNEIYPEITNHLDYNEYCLPSDGIGSPDDTCPIILNDDIVQNMVSFLVQRIYPHYHETLQLLAKCSSVSVDNRDILSNNHELREVVLRELSIGTQASTCYNALKLIEQGAAVPKGAFPAVARMLLVFSGVKPLGYKHMRCEMIEKAALGAMRVLTRTMLHEEWKEAGKTIRKSLSGKLEENLYRKVKAICSQKPIQHY